MRKGYRERSIVLQHTVGEYSDKDRWMNRQTINAWVYSLTLGAHAQRGLWYLSSVCVCPAGLICGLALVNI